MQPADAVQAHDQFVGAIAVEVAPVRAVHPELAGECPQLLPGGIHHPYLHSPVGITQQPCAAGLVPAQLDRHEAVGQRHRGKFLALARQHLQPTIRDHEDFRPAIPIPVAHAQRLRARHRLRPPLLTAANLGRRFQSTRARCGRSRDLIGWRRGRGLRCAFKILPQRPRAQRGQIVVADGDRLDDPFAINEKRRGNGPHIAERRDQFVRGRDGIIDALPLDKRLEHRRRLRADADDLHVVPRGFVVQLDEVRNLLHARRTPRRPKIQHHTFAPEVGERKLPPVERRHREVRGRHAFPLTQRRAAAPGLHALLQLLEELEIPEPEHEARDDAHHRETGAPPRHAARPASLPEMHRPQSESHHAEDTPDQDQAQDHRENPEDQARDGQTRPALGGRRFGQGRQGWIHGEWLGEVSPVLAHGPLPVNAIAGSAAKTDATGMAPERRTPVRRAPPTTPTRRFGNRRSAGSAPPRERGVHAAETSAWQGSSR